mmetsp:Transcript_43509/g.144005  ORF Transcript_43509/g.144005 Transcript_43509/m.144005 type:complete len:232 (-) Transcript_43509:105-800(-)
MKQEAGAGRASGQSPPERGLRVAEARPVRPEQPLVHAARDNQAPIRAGSRGAAAPSHCVASTTSGTPRALHAAPTTARSTTAPSHQWHGGSAATATEPLSTCATSALAQSPSAGRGSARSSPPSSSHSACHRITLDGFWSSSTSTRLRPAGLARIAPRKLCAATLIAKEQLGRTATSRLETPPPSTRRTVSAPPPSEPRCRRCPTASPPSCAPPPLPPRGRRRGAECARRR